jgi:hypothetical protein
MAFFTPEAEKSIGGEVNTFVPNGPVQHTEVEL